MATHSYRLGEVIVKDSSIQLSKDVCIPGLHALGVEELPYCMAR